MKRIVVLSQQVANQIAAGEVVERPASVVKELLENALDAGSTSVTIETTGGGIDYIRVTDNGGGIHREDVKTAFMPHSTSKITVSEDLEHIETLGFRGEALPSIAAVSKVNVKTRIKDDVSGTLLRAEGGQISEPEDTGCPEGTTFEVSDLFFNVPARLKFLKHARAEASYISDYVSRMILSHPEVSFKLISNGKTVYQSSGDGNLYNAIYCVYGTDVLPYLKAVHYDDAYLKITGYIGTEQIARNSRTYQSFFINGRYIKTQKLSFSVQRAFDTRLMTGKFPFFALNLRLSSREVDVNVHPNKLEVRFKDDDRVIRAVYTAARMALAELDMPPTPDLQESVAEIEHRPETEKPGQSAEYLDEAKFPTQKPYEYRHAAAPAWQNVRVSSNPGVLKEASGDFSFLQNTSESSFEAVPLSKPSEQIVTPAPLQLDMDAAPYKIVGALFDSFWVVQQGEDIFFIDQHAVHERRLYENMVKKGLRPDSQLLLMPVVIRLSPLEYETLQSNIAQFEALGFEMEEFGSLTMSVRAVPHVVGQPQTADFLHEALALLDKKNRVTATDVKRSMLIQSACKHAVKAGDPVSPTEIEALLKAYKAEGIPMTCPHGRPVMVKMSRLEFEKLFKRVV